jgi:hypothetical protein
MTHRCIVLAAWRNPAYLTVMVQPAASQLPMPAIPAHSRVRSAILWGAALLGAVVSLGAVGLWFHYGTAVFFEMIAAGVSACF